MNRNMIFHHFILLLVLNEDKALLLLKENSYSDTLHITLKGTFCGLPTVAAWAPL